MSKLFSKGSWPARFALPTLVGALVVSFGILSLPDEAQATRRDRKQVWSVKFLCLDDGEPGKVIGGFLTGVGTMVNIHNPSEDTKQFNIKFVISDSQSGGSGSVKTDKEGINLSGNLVHSVNCKDIFNKLDAVTTPANFALNNLIDGYVVIEAAKKTVLAVCTTYIFASVNNLSSGGVGTSQHVLCYKPNKIKERFEFED
ncbi:MAG: hypothetical protein IH975_10655 [Nitrospinae bacterium]|nr:hypothetical protein [Nitrospinota bacterium]